MLVGLRPEVNLIKTFHTLILLKRGSIIFTPKDSTYIGPNSYGVLIFFTPWMFIVLVLRSKYTLGSRKIRILTFIGLTPVFVIKLSFSFALFPGCWELHESDKRVHFVTAKALSKSEIPERLVLPESQGVRGRTNQKKYFVTAQGLNFTYVRSKR